MAAGVYDILIEQGASFELICTINSVIDLNDYTYRGQVRATCNSTEIIATFTITMVDSTTLSITLTDVQTAAIETKGNSFQSYRLGYYDIEIENINSGRVIRLLNGQVMISPEVTK